MKNLGLFLLCFIPIALWSESSQSFGTLDPFFSYTTQELEEVRSIPVTNDLLTQAKFEKWDPIIYDLTTLSMPDGLTTRVMAYVYVAQRDFALLSYQISQKWAGNPDELILNVIRLVYPDYHASQSIQKDPYSSKLGEIVFRKIENRFKQEQAHLKDYAEKKGPNFWDETPPYLGQRLGSGKPWLLTSLKNVQAIPPPNFNSIIWTYGIEQIKQCQARLTPEQRQAIYYWGGKEGPTSGNWFAIANQYLKEKPMSLPDFLLTRALLAMSYTDSMIAAFDSKYTYWVARPHMRDPAIVQIIVCPKHPSYPSAHSVTSATAATILTFLFPEDKQKWRQLAIQAGNSRIWAGLHFMYDNEQGFIQGEKVGSTIIEQLKPIALEKERNRKAANHEEQIFSLVTY